MAHGRQGPDIVANIRYAGASAVRAVTDHERNRTPDGVSAIDPKRSHLNTVLVGPATQQAALDALWASGVKPPAKQSETPYVQMVLSASPGYFRKEGQGPGKWDDDQLTAWREATMKWLRDEYGDDLVHASIHLDEDTPHIHALIVPTYTKKARKPGKRKRGETEEAFEVRKAEALASSGVRSAGRSSCEKWAQPFARRHARKSYHAAVEGLGLGYGRDFIDEGLPSPKGQTTRQWIQVQIADAVEKVKAAEADSARLRDDVAEEVQALRDTAAADLRQRAAALEALAQEFEAGTITQGEDGLIYARNIDALQPGQPVINRAISAAAASHRTHHERKTALDTREADIMQREADVSQREADIVMKEAQVEEDLREIRQHRDWLKAARETMAGYLEKLAGWLRRPDLPASARRAAEALTGQGDDIQREALVQENKLAARIMAMRARDRTPPAALKKNNDDVEWPSP